jgi:undecaprenyl-diphosphatase
MGVLEIIKKWDKDLFLYLNGMHNPFWDYVMTLFTLTPTWLLFYLVILVILTKRYGRKSVLVYISIILLILLADQISGLLKHATMRLRPSNDPEVSALAHVFFRKGGLYGFVSAHSANAFSFATFSALLFRNLRYAIFIFVWALMIAYTRIYLGVHYPGDILGGILLGILVGWGIYKLLLYGESWLSPIRPFIKNKIKNREANIIIVSALALMVICMTSIALLSKYQLIS